MNNASELKPCPFCGVSLWATSDHHGEFHEHPWNGCALEVHQVIDEDDAKRWNTRADLAPKVKQLTWELIPRNGKILCDDGMVIIRRPRERGGYNIDLAYKTVSGNWLISTGGVGAVVDYKEWHRIPSK